MFRAAGLALADLFDGRFRLVLLQALGLTLLLFAALGEAAHLGLGALPHFQAHWLNLVIEIVAGLGIVVGSIFLAVPVASLFVGLFLDDIARRVEAKRYPDEPPGTTLALWPTFTTALAFLGQLLLLNVLALPFYFVPGANVAVWLIVNGWILGREYFELAAFRHAPPSTVKALRKRYQLRILVSGILIALALSIPVLNLLAPLFGTAFMVHLYKGLPKQNDRPAENQT
jgi:CysZ protein